jgi:hypothetical protein
MNLARVSNNGEISVINPNISAIGEAQAALAGSEFSDDEILNDVMELRKACNNPKIYPKYFSKNS